MNFETSTKQGPTKKIPFFLLSVLTNEYGYQLVVIAVIKNQKLNHVLATGKWLESASTKIIFAPFWWTFKIDYVIVITFFFTAADITLSYTSAGTQ